MSNIQEARDVFQAIHQSWEKNQKTALLMITEVNGSAYRQPGAKMMMNLNGDMFGTLSGGCLESDLLGWTEKFISEQSPNTVQYDLSENELWSLGIGCKGSLEILIIPIEPSDLFWKKTNELIQEEKAYSLILEIPTGARTLVDQYGNMIGDTELPKELIYQATKNMSERTRAEVNNINNRKFVIDTLRPNKRLIVCGAGHDAVPVVDLASRAGFHVAVLDPRPEYNNIKRFPLAKEFIVAEPEEIEPAKLLNHWWVVMNHQQNRDEASLALALQSESSFIGVLGPLSRTQEMLSTIGYNLTSGPIYAPVGIDIGAETIDEVALSIVTQLMSLKNGSSAQPLHGRAKIHTNVTIPTP